jgi:glutamate-ammonia-ligase adenylyltransferase
VRTDVLCHAVRRRTLRNDVREMRERMRSELSRSRPGEFDLKQDPGGIADIEFLVQYWALLRAGDYPPVVLFTDNIRQLESLVSAGLIEQVTADTLIAAYLRYRGETHHRSLAGQSAVVEAPPFAEVRARVIDIWARTMQE